MMNEMNSPNGIANHTPFTPKNAGSINNEADLNTKFLNTEMNVDILALPTEMNNLEAVKHADTNGIENISIVKPYNAKLQKSIELSFDMKTLINGVLTNKPIITNDKDVSNQILTVEIKASFSFETFLSPKR